MEHVGRDVSVSREDYSASSFRTRASSRAFWARVFFSQTPMSDPQLTLSKRVVDARSACLARDPVDPSHACRATEISASLSLSLSLSR